jgi:ribosomal-protein-alanine N-acetyltransferase
MLTINLHPFPVLNTARLQLREIISTDIDQLLELRSNEDVMKYIDIPKLKNLEEASGLMQRIADSISNNIGLHWAITEKGADEMIGVILYKKVEAANHRAEVGYMLHPDHWRKGFLQEALTAVLDYGFNTLDLHSIEALVNPGNNASIRLLEKNNFVREALFRENYYFDGNFLDTGVYSLLKRNFTSR